MDGKERPVSCRVAGVGVRTKRKRIFVVVVGVVSVPD